MKIQSRARSGRKRAAVIFILQIVCLVVWCFGGTQVRGDGPERQPVRVGFFAMDGYHMIDEDGIRSGYGYDFLQMVTRYVNFDYTYVGYDVPWGEMQKMLLNGEIDMLSSVRKTREREEIFDFSNPIGTNSVMLNVAADEERYVASDYSTYNGMVIGLLKKNSRNADVAAFARKKKFRYGEKFYDTTEALSAALKNGEVDAIATSSLRRTTGERTLEKFATEDFYVAVKKGNTELLNEVNYAIAQMDSVEGDWRNRLYYKYYQSSDDNNAFFTEQEKKVIQEYSEGGKVLLVTCNCDREPYSYVEKGEMKGILPDIFKRYMDMCGIQYEFYVPESREEYQELSRERKVPVFLDSRMGASLEEDNGAYISPTYITLHMARVTRRNFDGDIRTVAVTANQGQILIEQETLKDVRVLEFKDRRAAVEAVAEGLADAAYVYSYTAAKYVNEDLSGRLIYNVLETPFFDYSISVSGEMEHELLGIITKCIYALPEAEIDEIISKYTNFSPENISVVAYMRANPWLSVTLVMFVVLMGLVAAFIIWRGRADRLLYEEEQKNIKKLQEQMSIISALGSEFTPLYLVNLDEDTFELLKTEPGSKPAEKAVKNKRYTDAITEYIDTFVVPEQREQLSRQTRLEVLKEQLPEKGIAAFNYQKYYDGVFSFYQMNCARVPSDDGISRMVVGYRNVDDVVAHEREQQKAIRSALDQAQRANEAKSTFLSNMSHDIRTPMNAIIGFSTVALHRIENTEQVKDSLEKILAAGNHLLHLINDILDMSRIESGRVQFHEQECSLAEIVHNLVNMNQALLREKELSLYADTFLVKDERICADPLKLNQVLINVMSNAVKYTPSGGRIRLSVSQLPCRREGYGDYEFVIRDSGVGMTKEFLEHIFEPFEREASTTRSGIEGTGLGMAITKKIVDMMGGTIQAESEKGKGSEFRIAFTFRILQKDEEAGGEEKLRGLRALTVDRDAHACAGISNMLEEMGIRCEGARSGQEAVSAVRRAQQEREPIRACFVSGECGVEAARKIRWEMGDQSPLLILMAYERTDFEEEAREAGVAAFCPKPVFRSDLRTALLKANGLLAEEEDEEEWVSRKASGKRVLLVEDNVLNREIATEILHEAGFEVESVPDGTDAVSIMEEVEEGYFDIILMDIQMPVMDGYEATRAIREMSRGDAGTIPIFAMSANAMEEDREKSMACGMNEHIAKPFDVGEFIKILHKYI